MAAAGSATPDDWPPRPGPRARPTELEPYYRAYRAADGFFVLACLDEAQRRAALRCWGSRTRGSPTRRRRRSTTRERARAAGAGRPVRAPLAREPAEHWVRRFRAAGVPAAEVRVLEQLFDDDQVRANGLVHTR